MNQRKKCKTIKLLEGIIRKSPGDLGMAVTF
jgi:hypothetical protein